MHFKGDEIPQKQPNVKYIVAYMDGMLDCLWAGPFDTREEAEDRAATERSYVTIDSSINSAIVLPVPESWTRELDKLTG